MSSRVFKDLKNKFDRIEAVLEQMAKKEKCDICKHNMTVFSLAGIGRKIWFCLDCCTKSDTIYRQLLENGIIIDIEEHRENTLLESRMADDVPTV